jgi:LacI family transcriptional regulator
MFRRKGRIKIPRVAILLESSHEVPRGMLRGILDYIRLYGPWALHLVPGGTSDQRIPDLNVWHGDGIIARIPNPAVAADIATARLPTVILDPLDDYLTPPHPLSRCSRVQIDSAAAARMAADYYLANGFRHFAFVNPTISDTACLASDGTGTEEPNWARWRREAFTERLSEAGFGCAIYPAPSPEESCNWELECRRMCRWLARQSRPLAVFAANDSRGRQVIGACLVAGIPVPYEVAVLGVNNDLVICETSQPPLSSVALDHVRAGFATAELLDQLMHRRVKGPCNLTYQPSGVVTRDSTRRIQVTDRLVIGALEFIRINRGFDIRVNDVANRLNVTDRWLEKRFQEALGHSVRDELQRVRMESVASLVAGTQTSLKAIASMCGQRSASHLSVIFRERFGMSMTDYRAKHGDAVSGLYAEKPPHAEKNTGR